MKNEQQNTQKGKQNQDSDNLAQRNGGEAGQNMQGSSTSSGKTGGQSSSAEKSNISVDNEGKIGKAHDQWTTGETGSNESRQRQDNQGSANQGPSNQSNEQKNNKTVTDPEIDAPIYDPEKTEKKIPSMESNKNSK